MATEEVSLMDDTTPECRASLLRDWFKLFLLAGMNAQGHANESLKMLALNETMAVFARLVGLPTFEQGIDSLADVKTILSSWGADVDRLALWAEQLFT
jgi:hypothetical protein